MQTLTEVLTQYCSKNNLPIPYGRHKDAISFKIVSEIRKSGGYESVKKKKEIMEVNNYPAKYSELIDSIIEEFFLNKNKFIRAAKPVKKKELKFFNFDIESSNAEAFEYALQKMGVDVEQNKNTHGKAQYKIPSANPPFLIKLGREYQKQLKMVKNILDKHS